MNKFLCSILSLMLAVQLVSCSSPVPPMQKDYADAVTNINQVDPYYRAYFRAQNGSNYTLADQRRAYFAAMQTARTPVRASDYGRASSSSRLAARKTGRASASRRAVASRKAGKGGKKTASRRAVVRNTSKAKRGRATASRRAAARRRRG